MLDLKRLDLPHSARDEGHWIEVRLRHEDKPELDRTLVVISVFCNSVFQVALDLICVLR